MPTNKFNLDTPCLVIDKTKLIQNLKTMQKEVATAGKKARPHCKTHKCTELAKLQSQHGAAGLCATKVTEALALAKAGLKDILITSPVVTSIKLQHLIESAKLDEKLMVVCDSFGNAKQLNEVAKNLPNPLAVLNDVDPKPGIARTGVSYEDAIKLGRFIHLECKNLLLKGLQCYAGNLQHIKNYSERSESSLTAMEKAAQVKQAFLKEGLPCEILSGSGTGTYDIDMQLAEVTEVQPGSYAVMDMEYREIGSKADNNCYEKFIPAMTMLVTVISANHSTHVTVDAGTKSIYFDPNTKPLIISHPGLEYDWDGFGDEHGKVTAKPGIELPKSGEVIELVVPHCDPTINLHDQFYITENDELVAKWKIDLRGCVQ